MATRFFRGYSNGRTYQVFYKISQKREKQAFQSTGDQLLVKDWWKLSLAEDQLFQVLTMGLSENAGDLPDLKINQIKSIAI